MKRFMSAAMESARAATRARYDRRESKHVITVLVDVVCIDPFAAFAPGDEVDPCPCFQRDQGFDRRESNTVLRDVRTAYEVIVGVVEKDRREA